MPYHYFLPSMVSDEKLAVNLCLCSNCCNRILQTEWLNNRHLLLIVLKLGNLKSGYQHRRVLVITLLLPGFLTWRGNRGRKRGRRRQVGDRENEREGSHISFKGNNPIMRPLPS